MSLAGPQALLLEWMPVLALLLAAGLAAGFAAGMFGVGGGFIVVPALTLLLPLLGGTEAERVHVAVGSSLATIVVTSLRSMQAHARRGAVDAAMLKSWAPWIVAGSLAGVLIASWVSSAGLAILFGIGVLIMAAHFLYPVLSTVQLGTEMPGGAGRATLATGLGAFSSLLGIGGGTIAIITMTLYGRSIHRAIGTASGIGVIIALPGMLGFMVIGWGAHGLPAGSLGYVNVVAALAIVTMSYFSAPWGAAVAHRMSALWLQRIFAIYLVFVGVVMVRNGLSA